MSDSANRRLETPGYNGGRMSLEEFHNGLRILLNLDFDDLVRAGVFDEHRVDEWEKFRLDPFRTFIRADEETAERIWELIQARQQHRRAA